jgi:TonB family protein
MFKNIIILFLSLFTLFTFQKASAQAGKDTIMLFFKNSGKLVFRKDSADYIRFILPLDPVTGLYKIVEINTNGKPKLITNSKTRDIIFKREGASTDYFPNGKKKTVAIYKSGEIAGDVMEYYPNGKLYLSQTFVSDKKLTYNECRDSTDIVLAENGNGKFLKFNSDFTKLYEEGPIVNGVEDGEWTVFIHDKKLAFTYTKGIITTPVNYDMSDEIFTTADIEPTFKGGMILFYNFLGHTVKYPAKDREDNVQGKVFVTFVVEKDGTLTNTKVAAAPSKEMGEEALRAVKLSPPWVPGSIAGRAVRTAFTVPINFTISRDN